MADTFEDIKRVGPDAVVKFEAEDGKPISGITKEFDDAAQTVTLKDGRVVKFAALVPEEPAEK